MKKLLLVLALFVSVCMNTKAQSVNPIPRLEMPKEMKETKIQEYNKLHDHEKEEVTLEQYLILESKIYSQQKYLMQYPEYEYNIQNTHPYPECLNGDFEMGVIGGWQNGWAGAYGLYGGNPTSFTLRNINVIGIISGRHTIMSPGFDPWIPTLRTVPINGKLHSLRLGNDSRGSEGELISKTIRVSADNLDISFWYSVVLENASHTKFENPAFRVRVLANGTDIGPTTVNLGNGSNIIYGQSDPFLQIYNAPVGSGTTFIPIYYRDWSCAQIHLPQNLIGQQITIQFITNDCSQFGHFGYAYIDNFCGNCDDNNFNIKVSPNSTKCGIGSIIANYKLSQVGTVTGSVKLELLAGQNGTGVGTVVASSPILTSGTSYSFPINPSLLPINCSLNGFDYWIKATFYHPGSTSPIGTLNAGKPYGGFGQITGFNNDYLCVCSVETCCNQLDSVVHEVDNPNTGIKTVKKIKCGETIQSNCNNFPFDYLNFYFKCKDPCKTFVEWTVKEPNGNVVSQELEYTGTYPIPYPTWQHNPGLNEVKAVFKCEDANGVKTRCDSCKIFIDLTCGDQTCCTNSKFGQIGFINQTTATPTPITTDPQTVQIKCGDRFTINTAFFCNPNISNCLATADFEVFNGSTSMGVYAANTGSYTLPSTASGTNWRVELIGKCGGIICKRQTIYLNISCIDNCCGQFHHIEYEERNGARGNHHEDIFPDNILQPEFSFRDNFYDVTCNTEARFTFHYNCNQNCPGPVRYETTITLPDNSVRPLVTGNPVGYILFNMNGIWVSKTYIYCGTSNVPCDSFEFQINVVGCTSCCNALSDLTIGEKINGDVINSRVCGTTKTDVKLNDKVTIYINPYLCNTANEGCLPRYVHHLIPPGESAIFTPIEGGTDLSFEGLHTKFDITKCGKWTSKTYVYCGNSEVPCDSCIVYYDVDCDPEDCPDECYWRLNGNDISPRPNSFIGTVKSHPFVMKTFATERMRITEGGYVGIGTPSPSSELEVNGVLTINKNIDKKLRFTGRGGNDFSFEHDPYRFYLYNETTRGFPLCVLNNGNVGIGVSSPNNVFQIGTNPAGYSGNDAIVSNANGSLALHNNVGSSYLWGSNRLDLLAAGQGISITTAGNVGVGTTTPFTNTWGRTLDVYNAAHSKVTASSGTTASPVRMEMYSHTGTLWGGSNGVGAIGTQTNHTLAFLTNYTPRMYISTNGDVGIGTTPSTTFRLDVNGDVRGTNWSNSDARFKRDIETIKNSSEIISKINGVNYYFKTKEYQDFNLSETRQYGFIAQDLEKVMPEAVITDDAGYKAVNYDMVIPVLVESQKSIIKDIETLKSAEVGQSSKEISKLKSENEQMKSEIEMMKEKFALLEKTIAALCESGCGGLEKLGSKTNSDVDALYQSIPNPTDDVALINYYLTKEYKDAYITVSTQDGKQVKSFKLEPKKGNGSVKVSLGTLANGTYLYILVASERVIDTKRLQIIK